MKYKLLLLLLFTTALLFAQQTEFLDFKKADILLDFDVENSKVNGKVTYVFDVKKSVDSLVIDAKAMDFENVWLDGENVKNINSGQQLIVVASFSKGKSYTLDLKYSVQPKKAMYFIKDNNQSINQIWTQGQGQNNSHWVPSFDDVNEKVIFNISVLFDKDYEVVANGVLKNKQSVENSRTLWTYHMHMPMSSYLLALAIGDYKKEIRYSQSGIPLELYYYPSEHNRVEPTYRYTEQIFDFYETQLGVPYAWEVYKQVPVKEFLYSGMENTSLTIFSDDLFIDQMAFVDRNYVNVNAHELAHQWFGNLVTAKSSTHHWLQEGFASYYALLAEREIFGDAYFYNVLYGYANEILDQDRANESTAILDPKASSITFYKKGAWALFALHAQIGDDAFKASVKRYLDTFEFQSVETSDFISIAASESGQNLAEFVSLWLESDQMPEHDVVVLLKSSGFMRSYFDTNCKDFTSKCNDYLISNVEDEIKIKIIQQMSVPVLAEAFRNSIKVRQAIAQNPSNLTLKLKPYYEGLLKDNSYTTIETALYELWLKYPDKRGDYLQRTKDIIGFNDHNVRLLWLVLHLNTIEYQPEAKERIYAELVQYTGSDYSVETRMKAFDYLKLIDSFDKQSIVNLMQATQHHNWRFKKYATTLVAQLKQNTKYKNLFAANSKATY